MHGRPQDGELCEPSDQSAARGMQAPSPTVRFESSSPNSYPASEVVCQKRVSRSPKTADDRASDTPPCPSKRLHAGRALKRATSLTVSRCMPVGHDLRITSRRTRYRETQRLLIRCFGLPVHSVRTALSMRARGCGSRGRSALLWAEANLAHASR